MSNFKRYLNAI